MQKITAKLKTIIELMGFAEAKVSIDEEHRKISIFIDDEIIQGQTANLLNAFEHIFNLITKKENGPSLVVDLNYYRRERERLIAELARAAAHKAMVTKSEVELPPMNAYERRLVHLEITSHPELKTESIGLGKERHIIIRRFSI